MLFLEWWPVVGYEAAKEKQTAPCKKKRVGQSSVLIQQMDIDTNALFLKKAIPAHLSICRHSKCPFADIPRVELGGASASQLVVPELEHCNAQRWPGEGCKPGRR